jgi:hypothetical protein
VTDSPRTVEQALAFARAEHDDATMDWGGYCQRFVRTAYGIPSLFASAWAQWLGADDEDRHPGDDPADAPLGAALCFKGSGPYGHIMLAAGEGGAWSNDLVRTGEIDWVTRTAPTTKWGQTYLGYLTAVNDYDLQLKAPTARPKPKHDKRYAGIGRAIERLEGARDRARDLKEWRDAKAITAQLVELRELYDLVRHS